jgi:hypothetical protein
MFYIPEKSIKSISCVIAIDPHYAVTFRHGTHFNYYKGLDLQIYREIDNTPFTVKIVYINGQFDFIILHSPRKLIEKPPPIADAKPGEPIAVNGYGNNYRTICYTDGTIHVSGERCYFPTGNFMLMIEFKLKSII